MTVAITGIGVLSPLGIGREQCRQALRAGRANIGPPVLFDAAIYETQRAGQVPAFDIKQLVESPKTYLDRCSALTLASCFLAVRDAALPWHDTPPQRRGLSHGTAFGCLDSMMLVSQRMAAHGPRAASPMIFTHAFTNSPASLAAIEYSVRGPAATFACGPLAGAEALEYGWRVVAGGDADFCLAGGADALSEPLYAALDDAGALAGGLTPAEGGVILVLEPADVADRRGAKPAALLRDCALAGSAAEALAAAGGAGAEAWQPPVDWGDAFGAQFPLLLAAAIDAPDTPRGEPFAVVYETPLGAAAAVVEVVG